MLSPDPAVRQPSEYARWRGRLAGPEVAEGGHACYNASSQRGHGVLAPLKGQNAVLVFVVVLQQHKDPQPRARRQAMFQITLGWGGSPGGPKRDKTVGFRQ